MNNKFFLYLLVMAGITYLIRMLPMVLIKDKIKNRFILSFLYYMPYTVLSVMTIPAIFYATSSIVSASLGFIAALIMSYFGKSLIKVASVACLIVFLTEFFMKFI